jgi:hypothetical protein
MEATYNETTTVDWIHQHVDGYVPQHDAFAQNFTQTARNHHQTNDRFRKLWFFNPRFEWMPDSYHKIEGDDRPIKLKDQTVIVAALSVRMLQNMGSNGSMPLLNRRILPLIAIPVITKGGLAVAAALGVGIGATTGVAMAVVNDDKNTRSENPYASHANRGSNFARGDSCYFSVL